MNGIVGCDAWSHSLEIGLHHSQLGRSPWQLLNKLLFTSAPYFSFQAKTLENYERLTKFHESTLKCCVKERKTLSIHLLLSNNKINNHHHHHQTIHKPVQLEISQVSPKLSKAILALLKILITIIMVRMRSCFSKCCALLLQQLFYHH